MVALPADTKISFAETPLIVEQTKGKKPQKPPSKKSAKQLTQEELTAQASVARPPDESEPEAEKPKLGELNEGAEDVPR